MMSLTQPFSENKIDNIDHRLDEIIGLLQNLPTKPKRNPGTSLRESSQASDTTQAPTPLYADPGSAVSSIVEGESSLAAQFTFANDFMQSVAGISPAKQQGSGGELRQSLEELSEMVAAYRQHSAPEETVYPHARRVPRPSFHGCELPPIQETVAVIRVAEC